MDKKYLQGKVSLLTISAGSNLYQLSNGKLLRVYDMCDDPEYEYGYDYLDPDTKKLIDGGVFNVDAGDLDTVVKEAMNWCDLNPEKVTYEIMQYDVEYDDLEEMGYSGF